MSMSYACNSLFKLWTYVFHSCMWSPTSSYKTDRTCHWFNTSIMTRAAIGKIDIYLCSTHNHVVLYMYINMCVCKSPWLAIPRIKVINQILPYGFTLVTKVLRYFTVYLCSIMCYRSSEWILFFELISK